MSKIKFDKFVIIKEGKYTLLDFTNLVKGQFTDKLEVMFSRKQANNGKIHILPLSANKPEDEFPVKFFTKNDEITGQTLITIPYVSIIWFTQYGNKYLRVAHGDDLFKVLEETKKLITLAKRAHSKSNDTKA
jgi:hypothetical protein